MLMLIHRVSLENYNPHAALNHLSHAAHFDRDFCRFLFKRVRKEVDSGCQELNEPGPRSFSREDLLDFDHVRYYDKLCDKFPTLMTCLVAATSNSLSWEEALQAGQIYRTLAGAC